MKTWNTLSLGNCGRVSSSIWNGTLAIEISGGKSNGLQFIKPIVETLFSVHNISSRLVQANGNDLFPIIVNAHYYPLSKSYNGNV